MADAVYLSLWLRGYAEQSMLKHFEKVLGRFPYSRLRPGMVLRLYALEFAEPPALEQRFEGLPDAKQVTAAAQEFLHADYAYQVDTHWDLWQQDREWKLAPAPVVLTCFGPEFRTENGEHLLLDLGPDSLFLPESEAPASYRAVQSNIRSVLHVATDLEEVLPVERRQLWTESGVNLADQLMEILGDS
jgi:hypothetical protein